MLMVKCSLLEQSIHSLAIKARNPAEAIVCLLHRACGVPLFVCTHSGIHVKYIYLLSYLTSAECSVLVVHSAYHEDGRVR